MAQFQARLVVLAFMALSTAIAANALYFQDAKIPANQKLQGRVPDSEETGSVGKVKTGKKATAKVSKLSRDKKYKKLTKDRALVKSIQRHLKSKKYFPGQIDGITGLSTRAAIMAFEFDQGLPVRGEPTDSLLKHIVLGPSHTGDDLKGGSRVSAVAIKITKAVQEILAELGYAPGAIDGMMGSETRKAIKSFEQDRKLPLTGRISGRLITEIKRVAEFEFTI